MSSLAAEGGDNPVLLSQSDRIDAEREQLAAAKSASDKHGEDCVVPFAAQGIALSGRQQSLALLCREPVPDADSNPADSLDASDSGRQFWAEQSGIGGLIGDSPNGRAKNRFGGRFFFRDFGIWRWRRPPWTPPSESASRDRMGVTWIVCHYNP